MRRGLRWDRGAGVVWVALSLSGCGDDPGDEGLSGGCDIQLRGCQRAVFEATAEVRGQSGTAMPRVRTITVGQFGRELEAAYQRQREREGDDPWSPALEVLGFLEPGSSSDEAAIETAIEGVAAFYDSGTRGVTILDRGGATDKVDDTFVLAHEFVHALQDEEPGLDAFRDRWVTSTDSYLATKCLTEGEAMVLGLAVLARAIGREPYQLNWGLSEEMLDTTLDDVAASTTPFFLAFQSLAYPLGTDTLDDGWLARGQAAIDPLYDSPMLSVIDWTEVGGVGVPSRAESLECYPTQGPPGYVAVDHDAFGVLGLLSLGATSGLSGRQAWARALEWRSDSIVLFQGSSSADDVAVAWRIRLSDPVTRELFAGEALSALGPGVSVEQSERDVLILGGTDPSVVTTWVDASRCGTADELPAPAAPSSTLAARVLPGRVPGAGYVPF